MNTVSSIVLAAGPGTGSGPVSGSGSGLLPDLPVAAQIVLALFFAYAILSAAARYVRCGRRQSAAE
ncbi:hypothetical protein OG897_01880 [Streptomyces sp. NBC_00237]|uniref:hypothetical protein n=1 Tax=Streptomyces sp. NBC_00237 TaxID=2975687 RepID=UPI00225BF69E|nr:hypothetical protein [Streptomyces sp. NBC_00237]MCX5200216.1 hypothetical protein [Streptomyces sp. NBC_00237]